MPERPFDVFDLGGGVIREKVQAALVAIAENIADPNCDPTKTRYATLKLAVQPSEDTSMAVVTADVKTQLVQPRPAATTIFIEEGAEGEFILTERTKVTPGQIYLDGNEAPPGNVIRLPRVK